MVFNKIKNNLVKHDINHTLAFSIIVRQRDTNAIS